MRPKVLIVEDGAVVGENLKEGLLEYGYEVIGVCLTGEQAVEKVKEVKPDIILMDIMLGKGIDGVEAAKRIHNMMDVPVIYLTAYGTEKILERAKLTGPYGFINKPVRIDIVHSAIETALHKHEMEQKLQKAKEAAEEASRAKNRFIADMSYEIRNPLTVIGGYTDLLHKTDVSDQQKKYLRRIKDTSDQILYFINDVLDYSRNVEKKPKLETRKFAIRDKITSIIDTYSFMFMEKGLDLHADVATDVPEYVTGDSVRIGQVLINLLRNALKFTEKGYCRVQVRRIETKRKGKGIGKDKVTLEFSVKDSGIGIPEEKKQAIFDSFSQADVSHAGTYGGAGLGLTIARQLVELMDGEIRVESKVAEGSTFTVIFRV